MVNSFPFVSIRTDPGATQYHDPVIVAVTGGLSGMRTNRVSIITFTEVLKKLETLSYPGN
jgi:hypothetical protein